VEKGSPKNGLLSKEFASSNYVNNCPIGESGHPASYNKNIDVHFFPLKKSNPFPTPCQHEDVEQAGQARAKRAAEPQVSTPFDPMRAKRHRQQARAPKPAETLPEAGHRRQQQADRRFFQPEHAASPQPAASVHAPAEEYLPYTALSTPPPTIYYDFQPSTSRPSVPPTFHDSIALPETFEPTYALPPPLPPSSTFSSPQRYQSFPTTGTGAATPPLTTTKPIYREQTETFRPGQVLIEKQQVTIFVRFPGTEGALTTQKKETLN
jgi:hypothetical protein